MFLNTKKSFWCLVIKSTLALNMPHILYTTHVDIEKKAQNEVRRRSGVLSAFYFSGFRFSPLSTPLSLVRKEKKVDIIKSALSALSPYFRRFPVDIFRIESLYLFVH